MTNKMKTIFSIIFLFICFGCNQINVKDNYLNINYNKHNCTKSEFTIDEGLVSYYNTYIKDAEVHGVKTEHIFCINKISWGISSDLQGITNFDNNTIHINQQLENDTIGLKMVFYHELGHWFGLGHSDGIMAKSYNAKRDSTYVRENWDVLMNDYFNKLK